MEETERQKQLNGRFSPSPVYTEQQALDAADYCLNCKNPRCIAGCPASTPIPSFIAAIKARDYLTAAGLIRQQNCFPTICGRVCQQEKQCEKNCVRGIKGEPVTIGRLEAFAAQRFAEARRQAYNDGCGREFDSKHSPFADMAEKNGKKVALIGTGPASMACGTELLKKGYAVTFFEASDILGGVPMSGIPEFRLPHGNVEFELEMLKSAGAEFITNRALSTDFTIDDLFDGGFEAAFIGSGLGKPMPLGIKGEDADFVRSASEFLLEVNRAVKFGEKLKINLDGKFAAVIGGGNVAMDAARCAKKLGAASVDILYRRTQKELPACKREVEEAMDEGIIFNYLTAPVEIVDNQTDGRGIKCIKMKLGEPDASGRARPEPICGSEYIKRADCVIYAIGEVGQAGLCGNSGVEQDGRGIIKTGADGSTARAGVFAGGDVVTGADTVVSAIIAGKKAAQAIDKYINS